MLPPDEFRTIKQPKGSKVCGAAVVAMVIGCSLETAMNNMISTPSEIDGDHFYRLREVLKIIGAHGIFCGLVGFADDTFELRHLSINMQDRQAILVVKSKLYEGYQHYVFWDGEHVRDSSSDEEVNTLDQYEICEVWPLTWIDESLGG